MRRIRSLLDPVEPSYLRAPFWAVYQLLRARDHLKAYESVGRALLYSLDGTRCFSSQKINCANCTVHVHDEQEHYSHMVLAAVLVGAGKKHVIILDSEFITPQDGQDRQDCEQQAIKRWVSRNAEQFAPWKATISWLSCSESWNYLQLSPALYFTTGSPSSPRTPGHCR